jgi:hypothetical protein
MDFQQHEARFSDIPIPFHVTPLKNSTSDRSCAFILEENQDDSTLFYKREMERMGWSLIGEAPGLETVLIFEKLQRICNVSIRPVKQDKKPEVHVYIVQMNKLK